MDTLKNVMEQRSRNQHLWRKLQKAIPERYDHYKEQDPAFDGEAYMRGWCAAVTEDVKEHRRIEKERLRQWHEKWGLDGIFLG